MPAQAALLVSPGHACTARTCYYAQILTHMKEKLQFVEGENQQLTQQLEELEAALAGRRDELAGLKATRDKMRQQGRQLKENSMYIANPMLLQDMQVILLARGCV